MLPILIESGVFFDSIVVLTTTILSKMAIHLNGIEISLSLIQPDRIRMQRNDIASNIYIDTNSTTPHSSNTTAYV